MADFVAVLKKTIDGLGNNTPEMREKVYDKARNTIEAKLAAINPPPPPAVADRQRKALEDAIAVVRAEYDPPAAIDDDDDGFEGLMASLAETPSHENGPEPLPRDQEPAGEDVPEHAPEQTVSDRTEQAPDRVEPGFGGDVTRSDDPHLSDEPHRIADDDPVFDAPRGHDEGPGFETPVEHDRDEAERREDPSFVAGAAPGMAAGWQSSRFDTPDFGRTDEPPLDLTTDNEQASASPDPDFAAAAQGRHEHGEGPAESEVETPVIPDVGEAEADAAEAEDRQAERAAPARKRHWKGLAAAALAFLLIGGGAWAVWLNQDAFSRMVGLDAGTQTAQEPAAVDEAPDAATAADELDTIDSAQTQSPPPGPDDADKFTQRLLPDGSEVDEGPAESTGTIGEGSSVAAVTPDGEGDAGQDTQIAQADETDNDTPAGEASVPVGQRAIFYEERTNTAQGSAQTGSTVWRVVEESPGGDLPPEPAIRAEATIPDMNLQLRMTIRRNGDETLPASHIIEMIFLTPDGFEGGGIDNIARISFKDSEQAAGNPLAGIPAKIADGFFLLALSDSPSDMQNNIALMRRQSWVDIPLVYRSGRRALMTLEKGVPGERIFQEVIDAWAEASSG